MNGFLCAVLLCLFCWEFLWWMNYFCQILSNAFSATFKITIHILSFILLMWHTTMNDLWTLNLPCIPGINSAHSWYILLVACSWFQYAGIYGMFCLCSSGAVVFCGVFGFDNRVMLALKNEFESVSSSFIFGGVHKYSFFFECLVYNCSWLSCVFCSLRYLLWCLDFRWILFMWVCPPFCLSGVKGLST